MKSLSAFVHCNKLLILFPDKQRDYLDLERKAPAGQISLCLMELEMHVIHLILNAFWEEIHGKIRMILNPLNYYSPSMCGCT